MHSPTPAQVDVVNIFEERQCLTHTELGGTSGKTTDVLGKTAAPKANAGIEESTANAVIVSDGIRELGHIGSGHIGNLCHRVDERNLGGKKRVRRHFYQLGSCKIHHEPRSVLGEDGRINLVEDCSVIHAGVVIGYSVHQSVGRQSVFDSESFAEKLGIPHEVGPRGFHHCE